MQNKQTNKLQFIIIKFSKNGLNSAQSWELNTNQGVVHL